jgi:hypothetical protein
MSDAPYYKNVQGNQISSMEWANAFPILSKQYFAMPSKETSF